MSYFLKECDGCKDYKEGGYFSTGCGSDLYPSFLKNDIVVNCPCKICLLKAICISGCEEYSKYVTLIHYTLEKKND